MSVYMQSPAIVINSKCIKEYEFQILSKLGLMAYSSSLNIYYFPFYRNFSSKTNNIWAISYICRVIYVHLTSSCTDWGSEVPTEFCAVHVYKPASRRPTGRNSNDSCNLNKHSILSLQLDKYLYFYIKKVTRERKIEQRGKKTK